MLLSEETNVRGATDSENRSKDTSSDDATLYVTSKKLMTSKRNLKIGTVRRTLEEATKCMTSWGKKTYLKKTASDLEKELSEAEAVNNKLLDSMLTNSEYETVIEETVKLMEDLKKSVREVIADIEDHLESKADEALSVAGSRASERNGNRESKHEAQSATHTPTNERPGGYVNDDRARQQTKDWIEELENSVETLTVGSRSDPTER